MQKKNHAQADVFERQTNIFTDGSKLESGDVGCAYVVYHPNGRVETRKFRLDRSCSVFQAELFAIDKALAWTSKNAKTDVSVFTDSLSSASAIKDRSNKHPLVTSIHHMLHQLKGRIDVNFVWVRAHIGIDGNEAADVAAKDAATQKRVKCYTSFPISHAKHTIRQETLDAWQEKYETAETGSTTRSFFPTLTSIRNFFKFAETSFEMTQFLSGHGFHLQYLKRFMRASTDVCPCGMNVVQDVKHLLTSCARYVSMGRDYVGLCAARNVTPMDFTPVASHLSLVNSLQHHQDAEVLQLCLITNVIPMYFPINSNVNVCIL